MFTGIRPKIIVATTLICSLFLFGMYYGYTKLVVDNPLIERIENYEQVEGVEFDERGKIIKVTLIDKSNLPYIYNELLSEVDSTAYQIKINDVPSEKLIYFYNRAQFIIQEALQQGNYQIMLSQLETFAEVEQISGLFYIDDQHIYLDLEENDHSLIAAIPRKQQQRDVSLND